MSIVLEFADISCRCFYVDVFMEVRGVTWDANELLQLLWISN
jgi:hypothetical protein